MTSARQVAGILLLVVAIAFSARTAADRAASATAAAGPRDISAEQRAAGLRFDASVTAADQQAIATAIQSARPEAQRLIGVVDGLVTVRIGVPGGSTLGVTESGGGIDGYRVTLDLGTVFQQHGPRGISRLVLHELGHVVDSALLSSDVQTALDGGIPAGVVCEEGVAGACANREERFAETFAKWATNDVGFNLYIGYKVPPPPQLDAWGAPLASVG